MRNSAVASNHCKRVLEAFKESINFRNLGSWDFWRIANGVLNKLKSAIHTIFSGLELVSSASDKKNILLKTLQRTLILMTEVSIYQFLFCRTNLKLYNISVALKLVKKVITNLDSSKASGPD